MAVNVKRVGHVGIHVSNVERSLEFYTDVLGMTVTTVGRGPDGIARSAFLRFEDKHHDFVLFASPEGLEPSTANEDRRVVQQISFEVDNRDDHNATTADFRCVFFLPVVFLGGRSFRHLVAPDLMMRSGPQWRSCTLRRKPCQSRRLCQSP